MCHGEGPYLIGIAFKRRALTTALLLHSPPGMDVRESRNRKQPASGAVTLEAVLNRASAPERGPSDLTGLKALMVAVLEDGIRHYLGGNPRLRSEAECWILASRRSGPFSFTAVCDALGLDAAAVREAVRRMRRENRQGRSLRRSRPNSRRRRKLSLR